MKSKRKKSYSPLTTIIIATGLYLLSLGGMTYLIYIDKNYPKIQKQKIIYDCTEDDWICENYKEKLQEKENIENYSMFSEPISDFNDNYFIGNWERLPILKEQLKNLRTKKTIGDGSCLIHSFLTSTSTNYRRLSYPNKKKVGQNYRKTYAEELNIDANIRNYIDDIEIQNISSKLKYNFLIFHYIPKNLFDIRFIYVNNEEINNYPWIMTFNTENNHYSSVMFSEDNQYIFDRNNNNIIDNIIEFVKYKRRINIANINCSYNINDLIFFENDIYIIVDRKFDGDPPKCFSLIIQNENTNTKKEIFLYELYDKGEPNFNKPINNF